MIAWNPASAWQKLCSQPDTLFLFEPWGVQAPQ